MEFLIWESDYKVFIVRNDSMMVCFDKQEFLEKHGTNVVTKAVSIFISESHSDEWQNAYELFEGLVK